MSGKYHQPTTVMSVVNLMQHNNWILPSIQRKFEWDKDRIINLFDSLLRGYPIGTLMLWKVNNEIINKSGFFTFLQDYQEKFQETTSEFNPGSTDNDLYAVIDGQQRLNAILIGLVGSYAEKIVRKKFKKAYDESIQPREELYINLVSMAPEESNNEYYIQFFSDAKLRQQSNYKCWFKIGHILTKFKKIDEADFDDQIDDEISAKCDFEELDSFQQVTARKILKKIYKTIRLNDVINYYQEDTLDLDKVVDIFVRTNSGGKPLAFSDLVMAITVSEWKEARDKIDNLVKFIFSNYGYDINRDFVLKVCLVMYSGDIRFRVTNIRNIIDEIKNHFDNIYLLIKSVCEFTSQSYIDNGILRSKYALIPIIYYAFKCEVYNFESNSDKYKKDKIEMIKWLRLSLLVGAFGGQPDALLIGLRKIIDDKYQDGFPISQIIQEYKGKSKDLTITKEIAESRIVEAEKGSFYCKLILSLTEMMNYQFSYHEDHLHPASFFKSKSNIDCLSISDDDKSFMLDEKNWNTIGNIHLLNASENQSKNDTPLEAWLISNPSYKKEDFFIPVNEKDDYIVSICDFRDFILKRREILINKLVELTR